MPRRRWPNWSRRQSPGAEPLCPLWAARTWDGQPHIVAITGVDEGYVYYNDPNGGEQLADSVSWFNTLRSRLPAAIMAKNPAAY
jgi:hypothetical protein